MVSPEQARSGGDNTPTLSAFQLFPEAEFALALPGQSWSGGSLLQARGKVVRRGIQAHAGASRAGGNFSTLGKGFSQRNKGPKALRRASMNYDPPKIEHIVNAQDFAREAKYAGEVSAM